MYCSHCKQMTLPIFQSLKATKLDFIRNCFITQNKKSDGSRARGAGVSCDGRWWYKRIPVFCYKWLPLLLLTLQNKYGATPWRAKRKQAMVTMTECYSQNLLKMHVTGKPHKWSLEILHIKDILYEDQRGACLSLFACLKTALTLNHGSGFRRLEHKWGSGATVSCSFQCNIWDTSQHPDKESSLSKFYCLLLSRLSTSTCSVMLIRSTECVMFYLISMNL